MQTSKSPSPLYIIRKIKRKDLDEEKYSLTLANSLNYRVYAEAWFLDVMTNCKWECLVYGDYEAIMPIPLQYKFGIKLVLQPLYCQQLGVFYGAKINHELFRAFENKLHKYWVRAYNFNEENTETYQPEGLKRVNHTLDLSQSFVETQKKFGKDRLKDIRRNSTLGLILKEEFDYESFAKILWKEYTTLRGVINLEKTRLFLQRLFSTGRYSGYTLYNQHQEVVSTCLFLNTPLRSILLLSVRNKSVEPKGAFAYMLSLIMEILSEKKVIFDFEGSSQPGIAAFNESFGAKKRLFTAYRNISLTHVKPNILKG